MAKTALIAKAKNKPLEKLTTEVRATTVTSLMSKMFKDAKEIEVILPDPIEKDLDILFRSTSRGFREVLLVMIIAKMLNPKYSAYSNFYECNPRALFEGPIRQELSKRNIPHGKSGPLNVAKATTGLNEQWAAQRRPQDAAEAVVRLIKITDKISKEDFLKFGIKVHSKFLNEAERTASLKYLPSAAITREDLIELCIDLVENVPDLGNTAQRICGEMLRYKLACLKSTAIVDGVDDRASTTTTTSKKASDLTICVPGISSPPIAIEVTTKIVNLQRLDDCVESIMAYNKVSGTSVNEILFLCRKEDTKELDITGDNTFFGTMIYKGIKFLFLDIFAWIKIELCLMPSDGMNGFYAALSTYVNNPNTSEKVKVYWKKWFTGKKLPS